MKYKPKEFQILKESFCKVLGELPEFYSPKIKYEYYVKNKLKVFEQNILGNYVVCKHHKLIDSKLINLLKNSRGLIYFLNNSRLNQKELNNFIKFCKSHEDNNGFLRQTFFKVAKKTKAKFVSGPFTQMVFDIIEDKEKKLKVLLNNLNVTISKNSKNLLYNYI